jgi:hypothetical protein
MGQAWSAGLQGLYGPRIQSVDPVGTNGLSCGTSKQERNEMTFQINEQTKHVVCFSGGHSSALVAIEVSRKYGTKNLILLNHDISAWVEDPDVKRFKKQVAAYVWKDITFANQSGELVQDKDQFDVCMEANAFKAYGGSELCTSRLKTEPFMKYLLANFWNRNVIIYYGFDRHEVTRIQRRSGIMGEIGFQTQYPLAFWPRTIQSTEQIGIKPPLTYGTFKHANCIGCLKAGKQHWYIVYCTRPDVFKKAVETEEEIGYSIHKTEYLTEMVPMFEKMKAAGIVPTEHVNPSRFWATARKTIKIHVDVEAESKPCECTT